MPKEHSTAKRANFSRWITAKDNSDLPPVPGCYAIYLKSRLFYVGSTKNLRLRFRGHQIDANRVAYKTFAGSPKDIQIKYRPSVKFGDWAMVELRLIKRLQPPLNVRSKKCFTGAR